MEKAGKFSGIRADPKGGPSAHQDAPGPKGRSEKATATQRLTGKARARVRKKGAGFYARHSIRNRFIYCVFPKSRTPILPRMARTVQTRARRVAALLTQAGLGHWRVLIDDLCAHYAGLEDVTLGMEESARAEIVGLLRRSVRQAIHYDDWSFAQALAGLGFFEYRVFRVEHGCPTTSWDPGAVSLTAFRQGGEITAYPDANRAESPGLTARRLLRRLRHHGGD